MKKRWPILIGVSILGIAGSLFLKKERDEEAPQQLSTCYRGNWWYINRNKATQHTLAIFDDFSLEIDGRKVLGTLVELNRDRLVFQDQYGYHLIVSCENGRPISIYDEADDETYTLEPVATTDQAEPDLAE